MHYIFLPHQVSPVNSGAPEKVFKLTYPPYFLPINKPTNNLLLKFCTIIYKLHTHLKMENVMTVRNNPTKEITQPIHVTICNSKGLFASCETSSSRAKLVRWSHSQVMYPSFLVVSLTLHPADDQPTVTPGIPVATRKIFSWIILIWLKNCYRHFQ